MALGWQTLAGEAGRASAGMLRATSGRRARLRLWAGGPAYGLMLMHSRQAQR